MQEAPTSRHHHDYGRGRDDPQGSSLGLGRLSLLRGDLPEVFLALILLAPGPRPCLVLLPAAGQQVVAADIPQPLPVIRPIEQHFRIGQPRALVNQPGLAPPVTLPFACRLLQGLDHAQRVALLVQPSGQRRPLAQQRLVSDFHHLCGRLAGGYLARVTEQQTLFDQPFDHSPGAFGNFLPARHPAFGCAGVRVDARQPGDEGGA